MPAGLQSSLLLVNAHSLHTLMYRIETRPSECQRLDSYRVFWIVLEHCTSVLTVPLHPLRESLHTTFTSENSRLQMHLSFPVQLRYSIIYQQLWSKLLPSANVWTTRQTSYFIQCSFKIARRLENCSVGPILLKFVEVCWLAIVTGYRQQSLLSDSCTIKYWTSVVKLIKELNHV